MIEKVLTVLKQFQADIGSELKEQSMSIYQKRPGNEETDVIHREGFVSGTLPSSVTEEKLTQINAKLAQGEIPADLQAALPTGSPFKDYGEIDNVFDDGKTVLKHNPGEVLLVDVWATWCGPCQKPMQHNQEMLVKNKEQWAGKARIVAVSVDQDKPTIVNRVNSKKWTDIIHLTLLGWKGEHPLIQDFRVQGIPFVCLVDTHGKIDFLGHPSQVKLQERINQLISGKEEKHESAAPVAQDHLDIQKSAEIAKKFSKESVQEHFKDVDFFCFSSKLTREYKKGVLSSTLVIKAYVNDHDAPAKEKANEYFKGIDPKYLSIEEVVNVEVPHPQNPVCFDCGEGLKYPFYWLKWEQGQKFGCLKCVQAPGEQEKTYKYKKNSVLLLGKWSRIPVKNLGQNIQPQEGVIPQDPHQFGCNGCGGGCKDIGEARYISLGCRSEPNFRGDHVDLCAACMQQVIEGNEPVISKLKPDGHLPSHPFLRILFNVKGYYEY